MPGCRIALLGGFRVEVDGRAVPPGAWRHRRAAEVVKLLALTPRHRLHREELIEALWPDLTPMAGAANLRKAVHFARRAMGFESSIGTDGGLVELWPGGDVDVDADAFQAAVAESVRDEDRPAAAEAAELYTGDLLPEDLYAEWAEGPRRHLRRLHVQALRAAGLWDRVVAVDPLDEEAHRELMRAHLEGGNRQAAMRQFELLREALHEELGVGPDPMSVALYQEVLAMEGAEPSTPSERAAAHLAAGLVALNRMDLDGAERQARLAREQAMEAGLGRELGEASGLLGMVGHSRGAWPDLFRQEFLQSVRERPELAGFVFDAHLCLAEFSLYGTEGPERVEAYASELEAIADRYRSVHGRALARLMLGESKLLAGRPQEADADLIAAVDLHQQAGSSSGQALAVERRAAVSLARGDRPLARRLLAEARGLAIRSSLVSHLLVRVHGTEVQAADDPLVGAEIARAAREELAHGEVCEPCSINFLVSSTIANARASRRPEAAESLEHAERVAGMWQGGPWLAAVWEARAELRLADGARRQAGALFREAADLFARSGHRLAEARCRSSAEATDRATPAGNVPGTPAP